MFAVRLKGVVRSNDVPGLGVVCISFKMAKAGSAWTISLAFCLLYLWWTSKRRCAVVFGFAFVNVLERMVCVCWSYGGLCPCCGG